MKLGVMNNPKKSVYDEAAAIGKAGFDFVDLTIEGPAALYIDTQRLQSIITRYSMSITGHTDPCLPYAYPVQGIRDACLAELQRCAEIFSALGAKVMNIHPCYFCPPAMKGDLVDLNIEALQPIVDMAANHGLTVVFENFRPPFDRAGTLRRILQAVPGLKLHLDVGHANIGRQNYGTLCDQVGSDIAHVHFSDNRSTNDHHMPLGVGNINWENVVRSLMAIDYDETITLEVFCDDPLMLWKYLDLSRSLVLDLWKGVETDECDG
jgi:sugar phosphate isomerase/epimerase